MSIMSPFIFVKVNLTVAWQWIADFPNQAALKTLLPCNANVTLTRINADMMLIVMYCRTKTSLKSRQVDSHTALKFMETNGCLEGMKMLDSNVCKALHKITGK